MAIVDWLKTPADKLWLALWNRPAQLTIETMREEQIRNSFSYIWLTEKNLRDCQHSYRESCFLPFLFKDLYQRLLITGVMVPFPVVVYLAVGYSLGEIQSIIPSQDDARTQLVVAPAKNLVTALNTWLQDVLRYERIKKNEGERDPARHNPVALEQFLRYALEQVMTSDGVSWYRQIDPLVCENKLLLFRLHDPETGDGVEQRLLKGYSPLRHLWDEPLTAGFMNEMAAQIVRDPQSPAREPSARANERAKIEREQVKAIGYYLMRAGITTQRRHLLDLHALAGYQAYGKFIPDAKSNLLLEQLRRQLLEPTIFYRSRESTVDGTTRRGKINQVLKWQLALKPPEIIYERYFNHKMLYLRRVSRKSQDLYMTLLIVLDIDDAAHAIAFHGGRVHSIAREVAAHLTQDCYQVLYQVPKLYTDTFIIVRAGDRILWHTILELADGTGKQNGQDVFLHHRQTWDDSNSDDPPTFFHFLLPIFETKQNTNLSVDEWLAQIIQETRGTRAQEIKAGNRARESMGGALPISDLMVTVNLYPAQTQPARLPDWQARLAAHGLVHQFWVGECGDQHIKLYKPDATTRASPPCDLRVFQAQPEFEGKGTASSIRQQFVQDILKTLRNIVAQAETV